MYSPVYKPITLSHSLKIDQIVTIHYFEYMKDFTFAGEQHDFWELLCVDKGEVGIVAGNRTLMLKKGDIIFHQPDEFHNVFANGQIAPNLVVISFICHSPHMAFFKKKLLTITDEDRTSLANIIREARACFSSPLDDPYLTHLVRLDKQPFGGEQIIRNQLELLLISLYRRNQTTAPSRPQSMVTRLKNDDQIYQRICQYMENHIHEHLTIDRLCQENLVGRSKLQAIFRNRHNCGVIDFYSQMKIDKAKILIRESDLNFSQISESLGYTSVHYFSRQFKKVSGMTPSEYATSIKAFSEAK